MTSHRPAQKADPEEVGVREFREKVATYTEPVRVYHTRGQLKFLGTWYPAEWLNKTSELDPQEYAEAVSEWVDGVRKVVLDG